MVCKSEIRKIFRFTGFTIFRSNWIKYAKRGGFSEGKLIIKSSPTHSHSHLPSPDIKLILKHRGKIKEFARPSFQQLLSLYCSWLAALNDKWLRIIKIFISDIRAQCLRQTDWWSLLETQGRTEVSTRLSIVHYPLVSSSSEYSLQLTGIYYRQYTSQTGHL